MIASRGLRPASAAVSISRAHLRASRLFSTNAPLRIYNRSLASSPLSGVQSSWKTSALRASPIVASLSTSRFASTSTESTQAAAEAAFGSITTPGAFPPNDLDEVSNSFFDSFSNIPERIGYLKEIGLDYGWGPTSCIEWLIEHIHVYAGTPWWTTIALTAITLRLIVSKLFIASSDTMARQQAMRPITDPITEKMKEAMKEKNNVKVQLARDELRRINKSAGIKPMMLLVGPVFQGVFGYCSYKLLTAMARLPVPGLETGGFGWVQDLTLPDPYFILPTTLCAIVAIVGRLGGESAGASPMNKIQRNILYYILPGGICILTINLPACLQVSFLASSIMGTIQSLLLRNPRIRERLNIAPLPQPGPEITVKSTLMDRYQAPRSKPPVAEAEKDGEKKGFLSKWVKKNQKDLQAWYDDTITKVGGVPGASRDAGNKSSADQKERSKAYLKQAEQYEKRRREEMRKIRSGRDDQQRYH